MKLGEKLAKLRRENNYTQEQLAELLGVSRQAVSKWEGDLAYPETEKLLRLGELYRCSMDYLLKDDEPRPGADALRPAAFHFERRSRRSFRGLPLWHINIGRGRAARGIVAVGLRAHGVLAVGVFAMGFVALGALSLGVIGLGALAVGALAAGSFAVGCVAAGSISVGVVSFGALSIGLFSSGALAIGRYFALGENAHALIAVGRREAVGVLYELRGSLRGQPEQAAEIRRLLDGVVPAWLSWAKGWMQAIVGSLR